RDGTLNREQSFVCRPEDLVVLDGVRDALARLDAAGYQLVVVTNQSGVARGLYDEATLARIHARLHAELDGLPRAYLHCPHHPEPQLSRSGYAGPCPCRKPADGLLRQADRLMRVDWTRSFVVGDAARDLLMARDWPVRRVLVRCGKDWREQCSALERAQCEPDRICDDLAAAASWILSCPSAGAERAPGR
ncbi:MAG: HAD-IIIA family hydrolase, partial [Planctomycetes bacterium]|nr:HAD-IIIA family hydrolase [Planctomycetota bacterium]